MRRVIFLGCLVLFLPGLSRAEPLCDSAPCKDAFAAVPGYVDAQATSFQDYNYKAWLPFTDLEQAPRWNDVAVFRSAAIDDTTCRSQDHCVVRVVYDVIGTLVPLQTFQPQRKSSTVAYRLARRAGLMLIAGPLPAKFVNVETCIRMTGGLSTALSSFATSTMDL